MDGVEDDVQRLVVQYLVDPDVSPNAIIPTPPPLLIMSTTVMMRLNPIHNFIDETIIILINTRKGNDEDSMLGQCYDYDE